MLQPIAMTGYESNMTGYESNMTGYESNMTGYESNMTDVDMDELKETMYSLIENYIKHNVIEYMHPNFNDRIVAAVVEILELTCGSVIPDAVTFIGELTTECLELYMVTIGIPRSYALNDLSIDKDLVDVQLTRMRLIPQHEQNCEEWFNERWKHITASSAWKALGSDAAKNSLICSKCKPISINNSSVGVNVTSPTHHGHKFEPLSLAFYEHMYDTKIEEFGCLPDEYDDMLAASPDGINSLRDNARYGYLLEIKNLVSRVLTGIPKREYWVQMQFQLHVAQLPYCDFLETVFKQYETEEEFNTDGDFVTTESGNSKGIIVCFFDGVEPVYKYPPWNIDKQSYDIWYDNMMDNVSDKLTWINNTYWRLEDYSLVTVAYNKNWFMEAMPYFKDLWSIILKERVTGHSHRLPKKRRVVDVTGISPPTVVLDKMVQSKQVQSKQVQSKQVQDESPAQ